MGLGPSIKMTTLHHFRCPLTARMSEDEQIDFCGILVDGVSENCDNKIYTAKRVGDMAMCMGVEGAIVAIDGWGNHHIDFVNVIEQLGIRGIPSVGVSYIGTQGKLVCDNSYVDCVVDFNKSISGFESCVVGQNNLSDIDAYKAVGLVKSKMKKAGIVFPENRRELQTDRRLLVRDYSIQQVIFGKKTEIKNRILTIRKGIESDWLRMENKIKHVSVSIRKPGERNLFVNSNLDFMPVACKESGEAGMGITRKLSGITVMLTGVEEGGYQPANIGSSQGILKEQVVFGQAGTPEEEDYLLHIDVVFREGEGRSAEGIMAAHRLADRIVQEIREELRNYKTRDFTQKEYMDGGRKGQPRVALVKIVSGLGTMYDTSMFPTEPAGFIGSHNMMYSQNIPYCITPNQCRDGVIHSLL